MKNPPFVLLWFVLFSAHVPLTYADDLPAVKHYDLAIRLFPDEERLEATARMRISNATGRAIREIPLVFYRLLEVNKARQNGADVPYTQDIVKFSDQPARQVNYVTIKLPEPLASGASSEIETVYSGPIYGYSEVDGYVKDRIDKNFSLIRLDAYAYPVLILPSSKSAYRVIDDRFTFKIAVTVPAAYTVAAGGTMQKGPEQAGLVTFTYTKNEPTWRMDIASAKFRVFANEPNRLTVFAMEEDQQAASRILDAMKQVTALYSRMFGSLKNFQGYTAIEIPDGWGSQASDGYFLQTAAAFKDPARIREVFHEIGHSWDVQPAPDVQRTRWFDEAFASYFEALAVREFQGQQAFEDDMEKGRSLFVQWGEYNKQNFDVPIVDYGKYEIGRNSYTKGAWALYVLHQLMGEEKFKELVRMASAQSRNQPMNFRGFQKIAEQIAGRSLSLYFQEWFYSAESSRLLAEKIPITTIVTRYQ